MAKREKGDVGSGHSFDVGQNCAAPCGEWGETVRCSEQDCGLRDPCAEEVELAWWWGTLGLPWQQDDVQIEERVRLGRDTA